MNTELQAQVDAQLMEQGAFAPLDLLFNSGRLFYSDYEAWRRREIDLLDEVLMGDRANIVAEMERAVSYARSIGLVEQPQEFSAWGASGASAPSLRVSMDSKLQRLVGTRYLPSQNAPQMDLFFDNPVVALTNGIARSLSARNGVESRRQLDRLYVQAPNHSDLAAFDQLVEALDDLNRPIEDAAARLEFLTAIAPTARHLLGSGSRDYLSPLWRHLADALNGLGFSPDQPNLHRSFALSQAQDWSGVSESIVSEKEWWLHAPLCLRLTDSSFKRRRRAEALTAWCHLCWLAPDEAAAGVSRLKQPDLSGLWQAFMECEDDEGTLTVGDFPAWLLLHEPGLARQLSVDLPRGESPGEGNYRCVHRWIHAHRAHQQQEEMALRKKLQQSQAVLFGVLKRSIGRE
ncbi:MAG: hypothetical protein JSR66_13375 [Proteobacteria bacterium]|nr:hypothetical protein [Pseudomonadota bacterium]